MGDTTQTTSRILPSDTEISQPQGQLTTCQAARCSNISRDNTNSRVLGHWAPQGIPDSGAGDHRWSYGKATMEWVPMLRRHGLSSQSSLSLLPRCLGFRTIIFGIVTVFTLDSDHPQCPSSCLIYTGTTLYGTHEVRRGWSFQKKIKSNSIHRRWRNIHYYLAFHYKWHSLVHWLTYTSWLFIVWHTRYL